MCGALRVVFCLCNQSTTDSGFPVHSTSFRHWEIHANDMQIRPLGANPGTAATDRIQLANFSLR